MKFGDNHNISDETTRVGELKRIRRESLTQEFKGLRLQKVGVIQVHVRGPQVDCRIHHGQAEFVSEDAIFVREKIT